MTQPKFCWLTILWSKSIKNASQTGIALCVLAQLAQQRNSLQAARDLIEESFVYLSEHDVTTNRALFFRRFGEVLSAQGDFHETYRNLCTSMELLAR